MAAFPRLLTPDGPQAQHINQEFAKADDQVRADAQECHASFIEAHPDPKDPGWKRSGNWRRSITVAMRGPRYLALVVSDDWFCGGAYPDRGNLALVYDLHTGMPVNWEKLLPKGLASTGAVASPELMALYEKAAQPDANCREALQDQDYSVQFTLWPDAQDAGIALDPSGLPHVIAACGPTAVIPLLTLRKLGVDPALLDAIAAAHKAKQYSPAQWFSS